MPRLTFRRKLVLAFLLVIVGAVGGSLLVVAQRFQADLRERADEESRRIQETYRQARAVQTDLLVRLCQHISEQPRFRANIEDGGWDIGNLAYYADHAYKKTGIDYLAICDAKTRACVFRAFQGVEAPEPERAPEGPAALGVVDTLKERIDRFRALARDPSAPPDAVDAAQAELLRKVSRAAYLLEKGGLYQVVIVPVQREDGDPESDPVGGMVVGVRVGRKHLDELRRVIDPLGTVALVIDDTRTEQSGPDAGLPVSGIKPLVERALSSDGRLEVGGRDPHILVVRPLDDVLGQPRAEGSIAILVRLSTENERRQFLATLWTIALAGLGVVLFGALVASRMARGISKPITDLVDGTKRVATGDYGVELPVLSRDELGTLTGAFNEMAKGLADRERYRTVLTKVVSKEVAHELMSQMRGQGLDFQGVSHRCTILFSDIRGFTPLTERMEPHEVISLVNEHMSAMIRVVERHRGVVNKFVGDEIIALFGAPVEHGDDPLWAVRAGMDMVAEVKRMNVDRAAHGKKEFAIGVGINTGNVVCGVMGSAERAEYTVLGAPVNLTARLCSAAKPMQVVITRFTLECVRDHVEALPLGEQSYKGFSEPIPVFEVRSVHATSKLALPGAAPQAAGTGS